MFPSIKAHFLIELAQFGHKLQIAVTNSDGGGGKITLVLLKLQLLMQLFWGKKSQQNY